MTSIISYYRFQELTQRIILHFQDYPKLSQTYYVLLECLAQDHMSFLATMEPQVFLYILSSISAGLTALGGNLNYFTGRKNTSNVVAVNYTIIRKKFSRAK